MWAPGSPTLVTIVTPGWYWVTLQVSFASGGASRRQCSLLVNGTSDPADVAAQRDEWLGVTSLAHIQCQLYDRFAVGDVIRGYALSGTSLSTDRTEGGTWLAAAGTPRTTPPLQGRPARVVPSCPVSGPAPRRPVRGGVVRRTAALPHHHARPRPAVAAHPRRRPHRRGRRLRRAHRRLRRPGSRPVDTALRVIDATPPAHVRVLDDAGQVLHEGQHAAPLRHDQPVQIGGRRYLVSGLDWPGRDIATGVCRGDVDWQHVTVRPTEPPPTLPARIA